MHQKAAGHSVPGCVLSLLSTKWLGTPFSLPCSGAKPTRLFPKRGPLGYRVFGAGEAIPYLIFLRCVHREIDAIHIQLVLPEYSRLR